MLTPADIEHIEALIGASHEIWVAENWPSQRARKTTVRSTVVAVDACTRTDDDRLEDALRNLHLSKPRSASAWQVLGYGGLAVFAGGVIAGVAAVCAKRRSQEAVAGFVPESASTRSQRVGGLRRERGESLLEFKARAHGVYREDAIALKREEGRWLSCDEFERITGRRGRGD